MFSIAIALLTSIALAHDNCPYNFGSCSDPSIVFGFNLSSCGYWGYQPTNQGDFPHGVSSDIATIESFICDRLQSPCNAPANTITACNDAFNDASGLSGDSAVDAWSDALGLKTGDNGSDCTPNPAPVQPAPPPGYVTTTTTTVYSIEPTVSIFSTLFLTTLITSTSTYTDFISTTYFPASPSSTLTITLTLPAPTTPSSSSTSTVTDTNVYYTVTTTSVTATAASAQNSNPAAPQRPQASQSGNAGGGSPFDSGANEASVAPLAGLLVWGAAMIHHVFI